MRSTRSLVLASALAGSLFSGLAHGEDAAPVGGRILFGTTDDCSIGVSLNVEVLWTVALTDPSATTRDYSTDILVKVGNYTATKTVKVFADPGAGHSSGPFGSPCGTGSVDGENVELLYMSDAPGGVCQFPWIKTAFPPVPWSMFGPNDVIQVSIAPTPGAEPESYTADDLSIEPIQGPLFYDRAFHDVELKPVAGAEDTYDVVVEYQMAYNTTLTPPDLRTEIVMTKNGQTQVFEPWCGPWLVDQQSSCGQSCAEETCAVIKCGGTTVATLVCQSVENAWGQFACACASKPIQYTIPSVQLKAGDHLELALAPAPGSMPEPEGLDQDTWLVCSNAAMSLPYGQGKAGTLGVPTLDSIAPPVLGQVTGIRMKGALPGAQAILFLGVAPLSVGFDGGKLLVDPTVMAFVPTPVAADGTLDLQALLPANPDLCGASLYYQLMFMDSGAGGFYHLAMTNGLNQVFGS